VAARFSPRKQRLYVAHVGDCRCYRLREGVLKCLTTDHTLASRGIVGPLAGNVCRAVGVGSTVKVDLLVDKPLPDDLYLLCSDGLQAMISDDQICRILCDEHDFPQRAVGALVSAANTAGGRDNITAIIIGVLDFTASRSLGGLGGMGPGGTTK